VRGERPLDRPRGWLGTADRVAVPRRVPGDRAGAGALAVRGARRAPHTRPPEVVDDALEAAAGCP
jgi:hypothetical protein